MSSTPIHDPGAFLGLEGEACGPDAQAVVVPVPYEATTTYMKGTSNGPEAILTASRQVEFWDEWIEDEAKRFGVRTLPPVVFDGPPEKLAVHLEKLIGSLLDEGRFPLVLGGEHSLSLGPIRAAARRHKNLVVLHLDAHPDLRDRYEGTSYGHGCIMRRVVEEGVRIHAFGLRAISPEERDFYRAGGQGGLATMVGARELLALDGPGRVRRILEGLPPGPIWLSWDIDGMDSSVVPSTGTPEPGGMDWFTVCEVLRQLDQTGRTLIGAELLELMPREGQHASDFACARLAHRMLVTGLRSRERAAARAPARVVPAEGR